MGLFNRFLHEFVRTFIDISDKEDHTMKKIISLLTAFSILFLLPAVSFSAEEIPGEAIFTINKNASVNVNAKAYLLMDANTGTVLAAKNENEKLYPASVTKIMTLLLVCEAIDAGKLSFDQTVTCSPTAAEKGGSQIWLEAGETMTVDELLKAAFVYSANDACTLLGEQVAGSETEFVRLMNEKAASLGMKDTHFDNCTGLDDDTTSHLSTAYDIALMSRELLKKDYIKKYTTIWMDTLRNGKTQLVNTNKLIRNYSGATGLKTGTTSKAGCCVSATAERDGLGLIAVVLGAGNSKDRFSGAKALLDYGFLNYEIFCPETEESLLHDIQVSFGTKRTAAITTNPIGDVLLNKGRSAEISQTVTMEEVREAPLEKGTVVGNVKFFCGDELIAETDLIAAESVERMTIGKAFIRIFRSVSVKN